MKSTFLKDGTPSQNVNVDEYHLSGVWIKQIQITKGLLYKKSFDKRIFSYKHYWKKMLTNFSLHAYLIPKIKKMYVHKLCIIIFTILNK